MDVARPRHINLRTKYRVSLTPLYTAFNRCNRSNLISLSRRKVVTMAL